MAKMANGSQLEGEPEISKVSILGSESIHLGFHLAPYIASTVISTLPSSAYAIVTDTHIARLHLDALKEAFQARLPAKSRFLVHTVPPGEGTKSRQGKAEIEDWLLENRCTRDTVILALGGGVIGDLVGFVAATFMRGIKVVQIPTTLLAMVDSAVGGKTAIDTPLGKNLIGAFHQPSYIFIDAAYLSTLPEREFVNGMAEVIKTAAIWDENEFASLESGVDSIRSAVLSPPKPTAESPFPGQTAHSRTDSQRLLLSVIRGSIAVKAHIVTTDEKETGLRNLVNFGHTVGHAIEAVVTPNMLHGECVSIGIRLEAEIARSLGILGNAAVGRLIRCLSSFGLPVSLSDPKVLACPTVKELTVERLLDVMRVDKKNSGPEKKVVLLSRIGKCYEEKATGVADDVIARVLAPAVKVLPAPEGWQKKVVLATPGSKSISNRVLVLAALGAGEIRLKNLLHSDDTQVMMAALEAMGGAKFSWEDDGETLVVRGGGGKLSPPAKGKEIYLGNAGTAARFVTTVCTLARPSDSQTRTVITGNARMKQRPIGPLVDALTANGTDIKYLESTGSLPLSIPATTSGFPGGKIQLAASVSSQYVSSILLSAPYAQQAVELELTGGTVISQPYIDMTVAMMKTFGIDVERLRDSSGRELDTYRIPTGVYRNPKVYNIESDASSSTYPLAIAAITGTTCTIQNIGSSSLQGDARFATDVLRPMGCEVVQTETETTVTGPPPGQLRALGEVDMEPMTDAFLTAAVLAAVATRTPSGERRQQLGAPTSTRIVGIANQRVKECNRIQAMIDQLAKLGVETRELDDGLEVMGIPASKLRPGASIHCYDDHRVAMAFSVLGTVPGGPGLVVEEKRCVEKTWPSWWDDLTTKIGIKSEAVELEDGGPSKLPSAPHFDKGASILILGMRGAGKSFAGRVAAAALGWPLVDTDVFFMERHQTHVRTFVKEKGWPAFRAAETEILRELLQTSSRGHIISLGGGVVEIAENREMLKKYAKTGGPVVEIVRDIDEIIAYLDAEGTRPSLGEPIEVLWKRRQPWFRECANCEFVNYIPASVVAAELASANGSALVNGTDTAAIAAAAVEEAELARAEMKRFFRFVCGIDTNHVDFADRRTYFLSLTFPSIATPRPTDLPALSNFEQLTTGCDAVEFRADLLSPTGQPPTTPTVPPMEYVAVQLSALRRLTSLPIVFTVRTHWQGGMFPDDEDDKIFDLLRLGLRAGCEYVDVELGHAPEKTLAFCQDKGFSQIIASWHDWSGHLKWDSLEVRERYELAAKFGDIIKIVSKANSMADNFAMMAFRDAMPKNKPLMTINMGLEGQMSRILTPVFSPVTHPLLPSIAAPGQLSFAQIQQSLGLLGQMQPKKFCLFGTPIAHSKSPLIHNTSFGLLSLPHDYGLHETPTVDDSVHRVVRAPNFGGASVTIPHKLDIIPLLDELTFDAKAIGAVNTVIPVQVGDEVKLRGDNTDWLAMRDLIHQSLPDQSEETSELVRTAGLVLGAGGTSRAAVYALHKLGFKTIYLFNRSRENAMKIVHALPTEYNIAVLTSLDSFPGPPPSAVISTIPASGTATSASPNPSAGVFIPPHVLSRPDGGVVLDMAYAPKRTPLIRLAEETKGWKAIPGIVALIEQATYQFRAWTGRGMPRGAITRTVMTVYDAEQARK